MGWVKQALIPLPRPLGPLNFVYVRPLGCPEFIYVRNVVIYVRNVVAFVMVFLGGGSAHGLSLSSASLSLKGDTKGLWLGND